MVLASPEVSLAPCSLPSIALRGLESCCQLCSEVVCPLGEIHHNCVLEREDTDRQTDTTGQAYCWLTAPLPSRGPQAPPCTGPSKSGCTELPTTPLIHQAPTPAPPSHTFSSLPGTFPAGRGLAYPGCPGGFCLMAPGPAQCLVPFLSPVCSLWGPFPLCSPL